MKCPKDAYAEILSIDPDSSDADKLIAWRRLGCMTHPHHCRRKNAKDAFEKLQDAASKIGVDQPSIGEVYFWDGKTDLQADDDSANETDGEVGIEEDDIPIPPTRVKDAYREATEVCIERVEEGGQIVRRLEAASEVGLLEVEKYKAAAGHKILSDGQSTWSNKGRSDFEELLWVTKSQTQRKNQAAGRKDPAADCCLGTASANARQHMQERWYTSALTSRTRELLEDPAKVEKDPVRRRAFKDSRAKQTVASEGEPRKQRSQSDSSEGQPGPSDASEERLHRLEAMMIDLAETQKAMNKTVATMAEMFERFIQANMASLEASGK
ncbi:hypothetical protein TOPH_07437 [Tolypocladium ophioglossoides CBS 100239]|uniref:J domain-containing protein n=1 Tax=Tolypocladium ophioglossoides (strain CBS 100239) TaxID=1163406 RepID=A0A0L0N151_TOLOC|nr:hypothetical protein TOPH_07437 [Tolypocladium ophioglossoides CBS 100239]